jgi:hypothetical protein
LSTTKSLKNKKCCAYYDHLNNRLVHYSNGPNSLETERFNMEWHLICRASKKKFNAGPVFEWPIKNQTRNWKIFWRAEQPLEKSVQFSYTSLTQNIIFWMFSLFWAPGTTMIIQICRVTLRKPDILTGLPEIENSLDFKCK